MQEYLEVGKVANTHGVKGEVKVIPLTDEPERFTKLKNVYIDKNGSLELLNIESVKFFKGFVILKFKEINDMDGAEKIKGLLIKVDRKNAVKLPKDAYFICDLIGCEVYNVQGKRYGALTDVLKTGSNDVYVVKEENGAEILVPALKSVVKEISVENNRIVIDPPEGLIDNEV